MGQAGFELGAFRGIDETFSDQLLRYVSGQALVRSEIERELGLSILHRFVASRRSCIVNRMTNIGVTVTVSSIWRSMSTISSSRFASIASC
jgi:hypothetical protein